MRSYFQGLTFLEQGDYRKALDQFIYIRGQNGLFPYIEDYISTAESSLEGSSDNNSQGTDDGLPDNVYLLLAVLFALVYLLGRKKEKTDHKQK